MDSGKKRTRKKEARPSEILESAIELFAVQGFAATKMSDIAHHAGIAKGTIYRYFETKDALFEAMVKGGVQPIIQQAEDITLRTDISAEAMLRALIETIYRSAARGRERRVILMLLIAEGGKFPHLVEIYYRTVVQDGERLLARIVERGLATGEFRDGPVCREPRVLASPEIMAAIWQSVFSAVSPVDDQKFMEAHIDLVLHGILNPNRMPRSGIEAQEVMNEPARTADSGDSENDFQTSPTES